MGLDGVFHLFFKGFPVHICSFLGSSLCLCGIPFLNSYQGFLVTLVLSDFFQPFFPLFTERFQSTLILSVCQALVIPFNFCSSLGRISNQLIQGFLPFLFHLALHGGLIGRQLIGQHLNGSSWDPVFLDLGNLLSLLPHVFGHASHARLIRRTCLFAYGRLHGTKKLQGLFLGLLQLFQGFVFLFLIRQHGPSSSLTTGKFGNRAISGNAKLIIPALKAPGLYTASGIPAAYLVIADIHASVVPAGNEVPYLGNITGADIIPGTPCGEGTFQVVNPGRVQPCDAGCSIHAGHKGSTGPFHVGR